MTNGKRKTNASAGHKLGQLVGDWLEEFFVLPLLISVADRLGLFLDHRFRTRPVRGDRILWRDDGENSVAYDFVMELGGSDDEPGVPVAFFECCWRRGSRHSKDKARDDTGKLLPMRETYPTARFLGIVVSGDFTQPARSLVLSRGVDLFYVPKEKVIGAFSAVGMQIEYSDRAPEDEKRRLTRQFLKQFSRDAKNAAAEKRWESPRSIRTWIAFEPPWALLPRKSDSSRGMILLRESSKRWLRRRPFSKIPTSTSASRQKDTCTKSHTQTAQSSNARSTR